MAVSLSLSRVPDYRLMQYAGFNNLENMRTNRDSILKILSIPTVLEKTQKNVLKKQLQILNVQIFFTELMLEIPVTFPARFSPFAATSFSLTSSSPLLASASRERLREESPHVEQRDLIDWAEIRNPQNQPAQRDITLLKRLEKIENMLGRLIGRVRTEKENLEDLSSETTRVARQGTQEIKRVNAELEENAAQQGRLKLELNKNAERIEALEQDLEAISSFLEKSQDPLQLVSAQFQGEIKRVGESLKTILSQNNDQAKLIQSLIDRHTISDFENKTKVHAAIMGVTSLFLCGLAGGTAGTMTEYFVRSYLGSTAWTTATGLVSFAFSKFKFMSYFQEGLRRLWYITNPKIDITSIHNLSADFSNAAEGIFLNNENEQTILKKLTVALSHTSLFRYGEEDAIAAKAFIMTIQEIAKNGYLTEDMKKNIMKEVFKTFGNKDVSSLKPIVEQIINYANSSSKKSTYQISIPITTDWLKMGVQALVSLGTGITCMVVYNYTKPTETPEIKAAKLRLNS